MIRRGMCAIPCLRTLGGTNPKNRIGFALTQIWCVAGLRIAAKDFRHKPKATGSIRNRWLFGLKPRYAVCPVGAEPVHTGGCLPIGYCLALDGAIASPLEPDSLCSGVGSTLSTDITHTAGCLCSYRTTNLKNVQIAQSLHVKVTISSHLQLQGRISMMVPSPPRLHPPALKPTSQGRQVARGWHQGQSSLGQADVQILELCSRHR